MTNAEGIKQIDEASANANLYITKAKEYNAKPVECYSEISDYAKQLNIEVVD
jgi:hypothetical protein